MTQLRTVEGWTSTQLSKDKSCTGLSWTSYQLFVATFITRGWITTLLRISDGLVLSYVQIRPVQL